MGDIVVVTKGEYKLFKTLVLVCAISTAPKDCTEATALDVIHGSRANSEITCGLHGQAQLASTSIGRELGQGEYLKLVCQRERVEPLQKERN